jgi:hypothetical protein
MTSATRAAATIDWPQENIWLMASMRRCTEICLSRALSARRAA